MTAFYYQYWKTYFSEGAAGVSVVVAGFLTSLLLIFWSFFFFLSNSL